MNCLRYGNPDSGMEKFCLWLAKVFSCNLESWALESGIQLKEPGSQ